MLAGAGQFGPIRMLGGTRSPEDHFEEEVSGQAKFDPPQLR